MGCCESRDTKQSIETNYIPKAIFKEKVLSHQAACLNIQSYKKITDSKGIKILEHVLELENENNWSSVISEQYFSAKKLKESKFNKEFIVTRISIKFDLLVPLKMILDMILLSEERKKWDNFIEYLELLEGDTFSHVVYKRLKVLFYSAEFIDRQTVVTCNNKVFILTYSTDSNFTPIDKNYVRADNIMGVFMISEKEGGTEIVLINQTDPKTRASCFAGTLGIANQKTWISRLKKNILKNCGIQDNDKR